MLLRDLPARLFDRLGRARERRSPLARLSASLPTDWEHRGPASAADMVFIGGCPRSGTSLLREMLGRHPRLGIGPEGGFFHQRPLIARLAVQWEVSEAEIVRILTTAPSRTALVEAMAAIQLRRQGKARYVEKTPANCRFISPILEAFPEGRFIHIVRDGRDVAASLRSFGGAELRHGAMVSRVGQNPIDWTARFWAQEVSHGLAHRGHPRCLEVRFERLIEQPEAELLGICAFLEEDFAAEMLDPTLSVPVPVRMVGNHNAVLAIDPKRSGRWRRDLDAGERRQFQHAAGALLVALGYATDDGWVRDGD